MKARTAPFRVRILNSYFLILNYSLSALSASLLLTTAIGALSCRADTPIERVSVTAIPPSGPISIALTGDASFFTAINDRSAMAGTVDVLRAATVGFTNLEVNLLDEDRAHEASSRPAPRWVFGRWADARELRSLGIGLVSLANNHALDFGPEGLASTAEALDAAGIVRAGAGSDLAAARAAAYLGNARRIALIAVSASASEASRASASQQDIQGRPGVSPLQYSADITVDPATFRTLAESVVTLKAGPTPTDREMTMFGTKITKGDSTRVDFVVNVRDEQEILQQVRDARTKAEVVIVSIHGHEPSNASEDPADFLRDFAHDVVDAGAQIVVGHGPHRLRGLETYKGALIFYSLGNFIYQSDGLDFRAADSFDAGQNLYNAAIGGAPDAGAAYGQLDSDWWWQGLLAVVKVDRGTVTGATVHPLDLRPEGTPIRGLPAIAQRARGNAILRRFSELSGRLGSALSEPSGGEVLNPVLEVPIPKNR